MSVLDINGLIANYKSIPKEKRDSDIQTLRNGVETQRKSCIDIFKTGVIIFVEFWIFNTVVETNLDLHIYYLVAKISFLFLLSMFAFLFILMLSICNEVNIYLLFYNRLDYLKDSDSKVIEDDDEELISLIEKIYQNGKNRIL